MADGDKKVAPIQSVRDMGQRNRDFWPEPPLARRRDDGTIDDAKFGRFEDEKFRRQPGRR